ncbi:MAG: hypothetical protein C0180_05765 [Aciduliprofundum sp.]|nr:MAG: hypothetical protein C0180_05765 [Aciduliprofundum sp.]
MNYTVVFETKYGVKMYMEIDISEENVPLANVLFRGMKVQNIKFKSDDKEYSLVLIPTVAMEEAGIEHGEHIMQIDKKRKRIILKGGDKNGKGD